jgi:FKBP-type peptidyl-prolyl cis-trans isomerase 2
MIIDKNTVITMHYTLKDRHGNVLETTCDKQPFEFVFGHGVVVQGLENGLRSMKAGDKKTIVVAPAEGYGERKKELVLKIPREDLPEKEIKPGHEFRKIYSDGTVETYRVRGFLEKWVYLDGNHPWAGMELHYEVKILDIKPANF